MIHVSEETTSLHFCYISIPSCITLGMKISKFLPPSRTEDKIMSSLCLLSECLRDNTYIF